jgi:predicted metal-binding protein
MLLSLPARLDCSRCNNCSLQKGCIKPEGYYDYLQIAVENGLSKSMFRDRVKLKWSLNDAANKPPFNPKERRRGDKE